MSAVMSPRNVHVLFGLIMFGTGIAAAQFYDTSSNASAKMRSEFSRIIAYLIGGGIILTYVGEKIMGELKTKESKYMYAFNILLAIIFMGFLSMVSMDASDEKADDLANVCYVFIALTVLFIIYCLLMIFVSKSPISYEEMYNPSNLKNLDFSDLKSKLTGKSTMSAVSNETTSSSSPLVGSSGFGSKRNDKYNILNFGKRSGRRKRY